MILSHHHLVSSALGITSFLYFVTLVLMANLVANTVKRPDYYSYSGSEEPRHFILDPARGLIALLVLVLLFTAGHIFIVQHTISKSHKKLDKSRILYVMYFIGFSLVWSIIIFGVSADLTDALQGQQYRPDPDLLKEAPMPSYLKAPGGMGMVSALLNIGVYGLIAYLTVAARGSTANDDVEGGISADKDGIKTNSNNQNFPQTLQLPVLPTLPPQVVHNGAHTFYSYTPILPAQSEQVQPVHTSQNWSIYKGSS